MTPYDCGILFSFHKKMIEGVSISPVKTQGAQVYFLTSFESFHRALKKMIIMSSNCVHDIFCCKSYKH